MITPSSPFIPLPSSLPSFLNAHCHLGLSHLKGLLEPGDSFADWLADLVAAQRLAMMYPVPGAARAALDHARETGTTVLLDIVSRFDTVPLLREAASGSRPLRSLAFYELLRIQESDGPGMVTHALGRQTQHGPVTPLHQHGLSPHAPYTTSAALLRSAAAMARMHRQWLCIHAAETAEETEFIQRGRGPLRDFLAPFLPPNWKPPGLRPLAWLDQCGALTPRTLLVHLNDVTDQELRLLRMRGCSAVVCPGSHVWFRRGAFPLERLLAAGIPTFLGTDSLASNEWLDMAREVRIACELAPRVPRERIEALASADRAAHFFAA